MKNKSFLSKFKELKPQVPEQREVERKLLPRLKFMGYVMIFFCLAALGFAIISPEDPLISAEMAEEGIANISTAGFALESEEDPLELTANEVLNFYVVSAIFASVGATCFLIARKKKRTLFQEPESPR